MGNKNTQVLPAVITKNWYPLEPDSDVFRNKLTLECVRQQIAKLSHPNKIQQLKLRMKESNPYICRVAFYYHLADDVYYVYTDETRNRPFIQNLLEWKIHKQNIVEAFISLSKRFGPTRVCPEMIGVDLNGQIKVWVNPNPIISEPWYPCSTEAQMISDILAICRTIGEKSSPFKINIADGLENRNIKHRTLTQSQNLKQSQKQGKQNSHSRQLNYASKIRVPQLQKQKFFPHSKKQYQSISNLKNSDHKTNSSDIEKEKTDEMNQTHLTAEIDQSINQVTPFTFQWDRTKTQVFENPFSKKGNLKETMIKHMSVSKKGHNNQSKSNFPTFLEANQHSKRSFVKDESYARKNHHQQGDQKYANENVMRSSLMTDRLSHYNSLSKKRDQSADRNTIQRKASITENNIGAKETQVIFKGNKLSNRLGNVIYMPVREERQSELTYIDGHQDDKDKHEKQRDTKDSSKIQHNEMTVSQQLFQFFDQSERREYQSVQNRIRKKSIQFEDFKNEVNSLFD